MSDARCNAAAKAIAAMDHSHPHYNSQSIAYVALKAADDAERGLADQLAAAVQPIVDHFVTDDAALARCCVDRTLVEQLRSVLAAHLARGSSVRTQESASEAK